MKSRTVIILWLIAILLGVSVLLLKHSQGDENNTATKRAPGQTLFEDFPADKIATIEISGAEHTATLTEKDDKWTVAERDDYPADTRAINDLLRTLSELKVTQGIEAGPSFAPRFGMDEKSSKPAEHGLRVSFKDSAGKELAKAAFGKNLDAAGSSASAFGGGATGRYVRNYADESGFYAVSEVFGTLSEDPKSWLSEEFIKVEKIQSIALTQPGSDELEWKLTRDNENADFEFTEAFPGVKIDTAATAPLKSLFSFARFEDVISNADLEKRANPEKLQKATITTFEGLVYEVTLQPDKTAAGQSTPTTENYLMTVSVTAELPKERKKAENEKKEEAEAADKAFADRKEALGESIAKTKALEGRTFLVSKFTVDALLKNRAALMDKGPGPGESDKAPAPGTSATSDPVEIPPAPAAEDN
ncbi:DUF4340 domain-containing protein [Luteolibacter algae]|uniref:DUF4340 domain-containing protein n=1 Tax=Luteolibacter algae TaxID=454151 RepID=A0ABW5DAH5_9BACT